MTLCSFVNNFQLFEGNCYLKFQNIKVFQNTFALMFNTQGTSNLNKKFWGELFC
jgi:hypothetical protein